jgi:Ion channel
MATMLYFSLTTRTTTGYGDIMPVDAFARSLANLESLLGPFYLAITVARLDYPGSRRPAPLTSDRSRLTRGASHAATPHPSVPSRNSGIHQYLDGYLCAVLRAPAELWLLPPAVPGRHTRTFTRCRKGRGRRRPYRGDFRQCWARRCNRGRLRRPSRRSTAGFGPQCGRLLLRAMTGGY